MAYLNRNAQKQRLYEEENARRLARYDEAIRLLKPFAEFAEKFNAKPISNLDNKLYGIHTGTEWEAAIRLSDMRAALAFIAAEPEKGSGE